MQTKNVLFATFLFTFRALAKTVKVEVGNGGLNYNPATITAGMGDMIEFEYYPHNHSVVQADYASPCMPMSGGIFSGFVPTANGEASEHFTITLSNTDPIWIYCAQDAHCQSGMVAVINPPSGSDMTLAKFMSAASSAPNSVAPNGGVMGGMLSTGNSNSSASTMSASMSASSMAPSKTAAMTMSATTSAAPTAFTGAASLPSANKIGSALAGAVMAGLAWLL